MMRSLMSVYQVIKRLIMLTLLFELLASSILFAQQSSSDVKDMQSVSDKELTLQAPTKIDVTPIARDEQIQKRLQSILDVTDWFIDPQVRVDEGVVFLEGQAKKSEIMKWAGNLARNTQDVVAVVNQMTVAIPSMWDFSPARDGLLTLWHDIIQSLPFVAFALITMAIFFGLAMLATRGSRIFFKRKIRASILRNAMARGVGLFVLVLGVYLILRVSGLTQLALTVLGGTGLIGLAVGIAFRNITENFLASIFLSMQEPFKKGDLVEIAGVTGYVQQLNMRTTILITLNGNFVQIPNGSVYKSNLLNFTTNHNRREEFVVGIGYDDSINQAQETVRRVLANHPAVLKDPEPWVLADNMGPATVNLRIYFWLDGREHSWLKVRSSVIRLVKLAFQEDKISMPDAAREIVFPNGVPITMVDETNNKASVTSAQKIVDEDFTEGLDAISTRAEVGLSSEASVIEEQARQIPAKDEEDLLPVSAASASSHKTLGKAKK